MNNITYHTWGKSEFVDLVVGEVVGLRSNDAHKRLLLTLRAYIDESWMPDGLFALGGCVAPVPQWVEFTRKWEPLCERFGVLGKNNKKLFKYSEMEKNPERAGAISAFRRELFDHALLGIVCVFDQRDLQSAMRRMQCAGPKIDFGIIANPYVFAFRALLDMFQSNRDVVADFLNPNDPIDFIFDSQVMVENEILSSWDEYVQSRKDNVGGLFSGRKPQFLDDEEFLPLQGAELFVGDIRRAHSSGDLVDVRVNPHDPTVQFRYAEITFSEEQIVECLMGMARAFTNQPLYDVRWKGIEL